MSALGQASLGTQCQDKALGQATLGLFCGAQVTQPDECLTGYDLYSLSLCDPCAPGQTDPNECLTGFGLYGFSLDVPCKIEDGGGRHVGNRYTVLRPAREPGSVTHEQLMREDEELMMLLIAAVTEGLIV
jgi:hypothetical protein